MTKEQLEIRIEEIKKSLEQSAANHNALLGRLAECLHTLEMVELNEKSDCIL